jgi:hypothetical protein
MPMSSNHTWNFSTVGGVKRVNLESGKDLVALEYLDQKLWTALSCPVHGLGIDPKTLELIDTDKDGQIRVPEILAAVKWITSLVKNPDDLLKQESVFPLAVINEQTEEGKILLLSAKTILKNLGIPNATSLTVEETSDTNKIFAASKFNGDGIITEDSTGNVDLIGLINNIMLCIGSLDDRGGKKGVSVELINSFFENCEQYNAWYAKAEADPANIIPFGEKTEEAYLSFISIKSKIEDYFIRCRLAEFDPQVTDTLNLLVSRVEAISPKDLSTCIDEIAGYPLAKIQSNKSLQLETGINPAWESALVKFKQLVITSVFPNIKALTESEWNLLSHKFDAYIQWKSEKAGLVVEQSGLDYIRNILSGNKKEQLISLIEQDKALESEANNIILVDKLVRYYRDIFTLLKNFVTFYDFYSPGSKAIFQAGTLYIDQRSCDLCIRVNDMAKHSMVSFSGMYLLYCDCVSKSSAEKMTIVAALTNGDIDNLMVGRNAVFYDRNGLDWNATVIKIVENPISIRQAFWSPYRKVSRFIETQINKVASSHDDKVHATATSHIEEVPAKVTDAQPKSPAQPFDVGKFMGIFAAIGLALGAIGTAVAAMVSGFMGLVWWKMPLAFLGLMLCISGPSMVIAYLKLRKRNLAPILDANGWAINARAIVNIQFGNTLTQLADLPKGAKINLNDPFTKKKRPFLKTVFILSVLAGIVLYFLWKYELIKIHF